MKRPNVIGWLAGAIVALALVEALFARMAHPAFPWHHVPGFQGVLAVVVGLVLAVTVKWLGAHGLQSPLADDPEFADEQERDAHAD